MSTREMGRRSKSRHLPPQNSVIESIGYNRADFIRIVLAALDALGLDTYRQALEQATGLLAVSVQFRKIKAQILNRDWPNAYSSLESISYVSAQAETFAKEMILSQWVADLTINQQTRDAIVCIRKEVWPLNPDLARKLSWGLFGRMFSLTCDQVMQAFTAQCSPEMFVDPNRLAQLLDYAQRYERYEYTAKPVLRGSHTKLETVLVHALHVIGSDLATKLSAEYGWAEPNRLESQLNTEISNENWAAALGIVNDPKVVGDGPNSLFETKSNQSQASRLLVEYAMNALADSPKEAIALARQYANADHELVGSLLLGGSTLSNHDFTHQLYKLVWNHAVSSSFLISQVLTLGLQYQVCMDPYWCSGNLDNVSIVRDTQAPATSLPNTQAQVLAHDDEVWDISFSPNGKFLASGTKSGTLYIWQVRDSGLVRHSVYQDIHEDSIQSLDWSRDSTKVLTGGRDGNVAIIDVAQRLKMTSIVCSRTELADIAAVCWLPDGDSFYTGSYDGRLTRWKTDGSELVVKDAFRVLSMELSKDGTRLVVMSVQIKGQHHTSHVLDVFDTTTNKLVKEIEIFAALTSICVSDIGYYAVNVIPSGLRVWHSSAPTDTEYLDGPKQQEYKIRSSFGGPYGKYLVSGSEDAKIRVYNVPTNSLVCELSGHTSVVNTVKWSPTDTMIASAGDDRSVYIWRPAAGK